MAAPDAANNRINGTTRMHRIVGLRPCAGNCLVLPPFFGAAQDVPLRLGPEPVRLPDTGRGIARAQAGRRDGGLLHLELGVQGLGDGHYGVF